MSWMELSLDTTPEAVDWIRTLLATSNEYQGGIYVKPYTIAPESETILEHEINPEPQSPSEDAFDLSSAVDADPAWAFTLCLYLPNDRQAHTTATTIDSLLSPLHRTGLTSALQVAILSEKPAESASDDPSHAPVHRIGDRFVVLSTHTPYQTVATEIPLRLQQTLAFGSGLHPATRLTLQLLERHVAPGISGLDLGSGSGILSVAMAKLGAQVVALDNDQVAVQATQDAVNLNDVTQQVQVMEGSLGGGSQLGHWMGGSIAPVSSLAPSAQFNLIVANILGRIHVELAGDYAQALRSTPEQLGRLITAGFTTDYEGEVTAAMEKAGFTIGDSERWGEWVALMFVQQCTPVQQCTQ